MSYASIVDLVGRGRGVSRALSIDEIVTLALPDKLH